MEKETVSALIGAVSALGVMMIKDIGYDALKTVRTNRNTTKKAYSIYMAPIVKATESLCWRIKGNRSVIPSARMPFVFAS
jgi:hypothetical protein